MRTHAFIVAVACQTAMPAAFADLNCVTDLRVTDTLAAVYDGEDVNGNGSESAPGGATTWSTLDEGIGSLGSPDLFASALAFQTSSIQPMLMFGAERAEASATSSGAGPDGWATVKAISYFDVIFEITETKIAMVELTVPFISGGAVAELAFTQFDDFGGENPMYDPFTESTFNGIIEPGTYRIRARARITDPFGNDLIFYE